MEARVTYDNKDVPNRYVEDYRVIYLYSMVSDVLLELFSPFRLQVRPQVEPDRVKLEGKGISSKGIPASFPTEFTIDASDAGYGDLQVQVLVSIKGENLERSTKTQDSN